MTCTSNLVQLPCDRSGVSVTSAPFSPGDPTLALVTGGAAAFPLVPAGKHYYVRVQGCGGCAELKITGVLGDILTVDSVVSSTGTCLKSNSTVSFTAVSSAALNDLLTEAFGGINFAPPLKYDCASRTLSIDCATMATRCAPCAT